MDKPAATPDPVTFLVEIDGQTVPIFFRTVAAIPDDKAAKSGGSRP